VGGSATRGGVLLRSDTLQELTGADVRRLTVDFGLRTILDLRAPAEAAREGRGPLAAEPVGYLNLSFLSGEYIMPDDARFPLIVADLEEQDRVEHYLDYLRLAGPTVAEALRTLARPGATPAIFHCAAGKDRTGVLAALLLEIAGVTRDAIVADFTMTNERIDLIDARLTRLPSYTKRRAELEPGRTSCQPEVMEAFLDQLAARWGGAVGFARRHGVGEDDLETLRALLASPAAAGAGAC
jgi:protein-tyrosine phosphatase